MELEKAYDIKGVEIKPGDVLKVKPGRLVRNYFYVFVEAATEEELLKSYGHYTQLNSRIPHLHGAWLHNKWTRKRAEIVGTVDSHSHLVTDPNNGCI